MNSASELEQYGNGLRRRNGCDEQIQVDCGSLQKSSSGRGMIYGLIATIVIASAHVAIPCHFLATFHFGGRHGRIRQAGKQRRGSPETNKEQPNRATTNHKTILRWLRSAEQGDHSQVQSSHFLPCNPSTPSLAMMGTMMSAATGSAHHTLKNALSKRPNSRIAER